MQQNPKHFAERLNSCLDDLDLPINMRERSAILSKMLHIPKQQAWAILEGQILPSDDLIELLATELEVEPNWLVKNHVA